MKAKNMKEVIRNCKRDDYHWFDKDTLNFWNTRIETELYPNNTFVTSEDNFDRSEKLYTVRKYNEEKVTIETIGEFQAYKTLEDAQVAAQEYKEA